MEMKPGPIDLREVFSLLDAGRAYSVFIDDTGPAGEGDDDTVGFVAVVVNPQISPKVPVIMHEAVDALKQGVRATEYHFKDIYHGRGQFEGVPLQARLNIIRTMVTVIVEFIKPAIFVQSIDSQTLTAVAQQIALPKLPSPFSLTSSQSFAFFGVLTHVCEYISQVRSSGEEAVFFCDEGIVRSGIALHIPAWPGIIHRDLVYFVDSGRQVGIQLADYAAFILNRHQYLAQKQTLSSLDKTFLMITEPVGQFFQNIDVNSIKIEYDTRWHAAHIMHEKLRGVDKNVLIIDERTGDVFMVGPDATDNSDD